MSLWMGNAVEILDPFGHGFNEVDIYFQFLEIKDSSTCAVENDQSAT